MADINPVSLAQGATRASGAPLTPNDESVLDSPAFSLEEKEDPGYGSRQLLDEVKARNTGREFATEVAKSQPPVTDRKEIERLETQLNEYRDRQEDTWRKQTERQEGFFKDLISRIQPSQQPVYQQPTEEPLPQVNVEDPELASALNAFEQRQLKIMQREAKKFESQLQQSHVANQLNNFRGALRRANEDPAFRSMFSDQELLNFAAPYLQSPQHANVDWDRELELAKDAKLGPTLRSENAELKRKIEELEKRTSSKVKAERDKQRANVALVPSFGQRGGNAPSSLDVGGDILQRARKSGKKLSYAQFSKEYLRSRYGSL